MDHSGKRTQLFDQLSIIWDALERAERLAADLGWTRTQRALQDAYGTVEDARARAVDQT
jgi:hypothetical protein